MNNFIKACGVIALIGFTFALGFGIGGMMVLDGVSAELHAAEVS